MPYTLDHNERIALASAMKLVLASYDRYSPPEVVVEDIFAEDAQIIPSFPFVNYSSADLYNIIWRFQETIYEAMCVSDFKQGIRSEFNAMDAVHNAMFSAMRTDDK